MNQKISIKELVPGSWVVMVLSSTGTHGGRSTFATASQAFNHAKKNYPSESITVQLVADDQRIVHQARVVLSLLQQHGYSLAGQAYSISRHQLEEMCLEAEEIYALSLLNILHFDRPVTLMASKNLPNFGDAELVLACDLV